MQQSFWNILLVVHIAKIAESIGTSQGSFICLRDRARLVLIITNSYTPSVEISCKGPPNLLSSEDAEHERLLFDPTFQSRPVTAGA